MPAKIRAAIIGCGNSSAGRGGLHSISYGHGIAYQRTAAVDIVAAVSRNEKNVHDFVAEFKGARPYQDYREMLRAERPDLVSVCAYPPQREEMVRAAIDAGVKAIWSEKPFGASWGAAQRMAAAAAQAAVRIFVDHQRRFGQPFQWLRQAVLEKKIGELVSIDIVQWGPNLANFGTHLVDAALYAIGDRQALRVQGAMDWSEKGLEHGLPFEKQALGTVELAGHARLTIQAGKNATWPLPLIRAQGTAGFAELHMSPPPGAASVFCARYAGLPDLISPPTDEHFHAGPDQNLYTDRAAADIVRCLRTGEPSRIDAAEALRTMEIIMALYESARQQKMLDLPLTVEAPIE